MLPWISAARSWPWLVPVMAHPDLYRLMDGPYVPRYIDDAGAFLSQQTCNYSFTHSTVVSVRSWLARDYFISWEARPVVSVSRLFGRDSQQLPTVMAWTFAAETRQSILICSVSAMLRADRCLLFGQKGWCVLRQLRCLLLRKEGFLLLGRGKACC